MKNYDEVDKRILYRPIHSEKLLWKQHLIGDFVFATNGHIAIKIPILRLSGAYKANPDYPDIVLLFNKRDGLFDKTKIYKVESIEKLLSEIPRVKVGTNVRNATEMEMFRQKTPCDTIWEKCLTVKVRENYSLRKTEYDWKNHKFQIGDSYFNPNYIEKLVIVAKINDIKQVEHFAGLPEGQNHFRIDGIEIIIMPMKINNEDGLPGDYIYHKIEDETI